MIAYLFVFIHLFHQMEAGCENPFLPVPFESKKLSLGWAGDLPIRKSMGLGDGK
jgi:hypothetical protein